MVEACRLGKGLGLGNCNCLTRTRLLCQKERGLKKQRESKRSWASEEGGKLGPEEGAQRVLEGRRGGTAGTGGAAEVVEAGVHWCVQCAQ